MVPMLIFWSLFFLLLLAYIKIQDFNIAVTWTIIHISFPLKYIFHKTDVFLMKNKLFHLKIP